MGVIWHIQGVDIQEMECYIWCSNLEQDKSKMGDWRNLYEKLFEMSLNGSISTKNVNLSSTDHRSYSSYEYLSPATVYTFSSNSQENKILASNPFHSNPEQELTLVGAKLFWLQDTVCEFNIFCPILKENVCGDYGLKLIQDNGGQEHNICQEFNGFKTKITNDSVIEIQMWKLNDVT